MKPWTTVDEFHRLRGVESDCHSATLTAKISLFQQSYHDFAHGGPELIPVRIARSFIVMSAPDYVGGW